MRGSIFIFMILQLMSILLCAKTIIALFKFRRIMTAHLNKQKKQVYFNVKQKVLRKTIKMS